jgi:hypothetical protein
MAGAPRCNPLAVALWGRPLPGAGRCLCHLEDHFDFDGDAKG